MTTGIEWTDETWNPIVGCSVVLPGCANCYAMKQAARIEMMHEGRHAPHAKVGSPEFPATPYAGLTQTSKAGPVWTGKVALASDQTLTKPMRWKSGRRIFVNSMGDVFHESVPDEWIDRVFAVMALAPQHQFQVLTKRSKRMREYFAVRQTGDPWAEAADAVADMIGMADYPVVLEPKDIPLLNVWLGVSTEDQDRANERIPDLLATPAAVRFVSAEPLLGPINLRMLKQPNGGAGPWWIDALTVDGGGWFHDVEQSDPMDDSQVRWNDTESRLDWVIVGGESGPGARPMHPDWARAIRNQCAAAGVPFFFKQWGEFAPAFDRDFRPISGLPWSGNDQRAVANGTATAAQSTKRVGKASAGRLLDGVEHNAFPRDAA